MFAACVVIASSTDSLLTTAPGSASFLFHAVLLVAVSVVLLAPHVLSKARGGAVRDDLTATVVSSPQLGPTG